MAIYVLYQLIKDHPDAELCMVGPDKDGSIEECKILAKKLGVSDSVLFTGRLSKKEWHELSENYSVFINTTNFDNTHVSVIEAMALGLPVVSTSVGGIPYLLEDGKDALLVEKSNVLQMKDAVKSIIDDEKLASQLVTNARKKAESFDWNKVKNDWNEVLNL
jgi:glycosyltransferase involved in cell wall biosynthesis